MRHWFVVFLLTLVGLWGPGCYTASSPTSSRADEAPAYTRGAQHYRAFADADAVAAYLRYGSPAGPLVSAHRGGPAPGFPENALPTFERALRHAPAMPEVDVRLSRDSVLVLMHDETLDRTTTGRGPLAEQPLAALRRLLLKDERGITTPFRIPTLDEALAWAEGRAVLQLDVKKGVPPARIVEAIRRAGAENRVMVIVYDLADLMHYHRLAPELVLSATVTTERELDALLTSGVDLSRIVAFTGVGELQPALIERLHAHGIRAILGTFGLIDQRARTAGPEVFSALLDRGVDILATDAVPEAARAVEMAVKAGAPAR